MSFSLKQTLVTIQHKADPDGLYVEDILATCGARSQALLILVFSLPFAQPVPLIGLSTPLGIIIALFGIFLALEKRVWLPQFLMRRHLNPKIVLSCCRVFIKVLNKTEKFVKPRMGVWLSLTSTRWVNGILIVIFASLLALPLPIPLSNIIPAYFLIVNALGWLEEDGVVILVSYVIALIGFVFFLALGLGAKEIVQFFT